MDGLIMDFPLTLPLVLERAATLFGNREVVTRRADHSLHRSTYRDVAGRATQLAAALQQLGIQPGDRVATLSWNHHQHLEAYFGIPLTGAVLHTLNLLLHRTDLAYIVNHAGDRAIIVDDVLLPLLAQFQSEIDVSHIIVVSTGAEAPLPDGAIDYDELLAAADVSAFQPPEIAERQAAAMCYTSGTTGKPKGVVYSHRALVLHALAAMTSEMLALAEGDSVLPVVPMFHANAWGLAYAATFCGAKQVLPGPFLDPASLLELVEAERVTITAGVPTIWLGLLHYLEEHPDEFDVSTLERMPVGGQSVPLSLIQAYRERYGIDVIQGWGMTETGPVGTFSRLAPDLEHASSAVQDHYRSTVGRPVSLVQLRLRGPEGLLPWDGESMGEIEIQGPWVSSSYYDNPEAAGSFTADGWLRTGDIATIDHRGYVTIKDRAKDLIKSGGEWISSVALENQLMAHPAVAEAAVIAAEHAKWLERPVAIVVLRRGATATEEELRDYLAPHFAKWWLPDAILFVNEIPRTSTGKFMKATLRESYSRVLLDRAESATESVATTSHQRGFGKRMKHSNSRTA